MLQVKTEDRHALLTILDCSKADSGPYMITADNSLGSDFATINVQGSVQQPRSHVTMFNVLI